MNSPVSQRRYGVGTGGRILTTCQCVTGWLYLTPVDPPAHSFQQRMWQVTCEGCGCAGPWAKTEGEACEAWNKMRGVKP